jgi:hypothetical protein
MKIAGGCGHLSLVLRLLYITFHAVTKGQF